MSNWTRDRHSERWPSQRLVLCRLVAGLPPILGSAVLLALVLADAPAPAALLVLLAWLGGGACLLSRTGERLAVRGCCGFQPPTASQQRQLSAIAAAAVHRAGLPAVSVDWYVIPQPTVNAYAVGAHSVAVSTGFLRHYGLAEPPTQGAVAILLHELGHLVTCGTRYTLPIRWLAGPWRIATLLTVRLPIQLFGLRRHPRLVATVLAVGAVVAAGQGLSQHSWAGATTLVALTALTLGVFVATIAANREAEYAADRFAAEHGLATELADALASLDVEGRSGCLSHHPPSESRIRTLVLDTALGRKTNDSQSAARFHDLPARTEGRAAAR